MRIFWVAANPGLTFAFFLLAFAEPLLNSGQTPVPEKPPVASRVVTLKVHYINLSQQGGPWSVADWDRRNAAMDVAYKAIAPDVMAFQEMASLADRDDGSVNLARDFLLSQNPDYSAAVVED